MELQRCIWRCLANSPGNDSPEYNQCLARNCSGDAQTGLQPPVSGQPWQAGTATDGATRFAGIDLPDGSGRGVYYMCTAAGDSYLMLFAQQSPAGTYQLVIDGSRYPVPFDRSRQQLTLSLQPYSPLLIQLSQGQWLSVIDIYGTAIMQVSLAGAGQALNAARAACGR